jgi:hypothetical protein
VERRKTTGPSWTMDGGPGMGDWRRVGNCAAVKTSTTAANDSWIGSSNGDRARQKRDT